MTMGGNSVQAERLVSIVERIERMLEERKAINIDISEIYSEAKGAGYDTKIIRQAIKRRAMDVADRQEQDALLEVYERALGQLRDTPLGAATMERVSAASPS